VAGVKIAHILATADRTGAELAVLNLNRGLRAQGAEPRVFFFREGEMLEDFRAAGIPCEVVHVAGKFDLRAVQRLSAHLRSFDVVHTHGSRAMFIGNLAARRARVPRVFTTFHELSTAKRGETRLPSVYLLIERVLARFCTTHCIANSDATRQDAMRTRGIPADRITRIYNAADLGQFNVSDDRGMWRRKLGFSADDLLIGVVGRLSAPKGTRYGIEALPRIRQVFPKARLLLVGEGPLRADLETLARRLNVGEFVHFPGTFRDLNPVYNALDLLMQPSVSEAFGLAVLDAIQCGVPVVVTESGGLPEVAALSPRSRVVPAGDSAALADASIELLSVKAPREAPAGLAILFSPDRVARQHLDLYSQASGR